jgi:hypothetical protein
MQQAELVLQGELVEKAECRGGVGAVRHQELPDRGPSNRFDSCRENYVDVPSLGHDLLFVVASA